MKSLPESICPRCQQATVRRDKRRCINEKCSGRLLWSGDDAHRVYDHWYMWYRGLRGLGWYDRGYFTTQPIHIPANPGFGTTELE
jgi:hypothetical protein